MERIVSKFLKSQRIPVSRRHIEKRIRSHPDYPSLLSIADTLGSLGINYGVWKATKDELYEAEFPYLLPISLEDFSLVSVKNRKDLANLDKQLNYWNGIILQVEARDFKPDGETRGLYNSEKIRGAGLLALLGAITCWLLAPLLWNFSSGSFLLLLTALAGVVVGYVLVLKDLGIRYASVESFCGSGRKINCDVVLNSKGATLLGGIKLSDVVLIHFLFLSISISSQLYFPGWSSSILFLLYGMGILSIPAVLMSIIYQYSVAKAWCKLCLIVSVVLMVQLAILSVFFDSRTMSEVSPVAILAGLILWFVIAVLALLVKDFIAQGIKVERDLAFANRVKNSIDVFSMLLFKQPRVATTSFPDEIVIGDPGAPINLTVVSNLFCSPCKEQHEVLSRLLDLYPEKINLTFRLWPESHAKNGSEANHYVIQYWKECILGKENASVNASQMLHDWFATMDLNIFKTQYPLQNGIDEATRKLEVYQSSWMAESSVVSTPTLFINGYRMPRSFQAKDLAILMPSLWEFMEKTRSEPEITSVLN